MPTQACMDAATTALPFCNTSLPIAVRVDDLVDRLTIEEIASGVLAMLMVPTRTANGTDVNHNLRQTAGTGLIPTVTPV